MEIKHDKCNKRASDIPTVFIHHADGGRETLSSASLKQSPETPPVSLTGLTFISQLEKSLW